MALKEKDLLDKKKEIETAKDELNSLKGEKKVYESQLKKDWECSTLKEAKLKISSLKQQEETLQAQIEKELASIEEKYFNDDES